MFVECLVDYVPGENLAGIVLHHGGDVFLQEMGQLLGSEVRCRLAIWDCRDPKAGNGRGLSYRGRARSGQSHLLAENRIRLVGGGRSTTSCVFRFDHVEFATEGLGVGRLGKGIRTDRGAHQQACGCGGLAQGGWRRRTGRKEQRQKTQKHE